MSSSKPVVVERMIGGRTLSLETNRIAKQATGSVLVRYGDTVVLAASCFGREVQQNFFPLTVDYREKTYAAGKFPGGYFKREGRPTTREILTCRLVDRPHRPLFPKGYRTEVAVNIMPLSADLENEPDILAMIGGSASLALCEGYPFAGPTGSVRIGRIGGELVINPTNQELKESDLDLVVAGLEDAIIMVEGGAKEVSEEVLLEALELAQTPIREVIALQKELVEKAGKQLYQPPAEEPAPYDVALVDALSGTYQAKFAEASKVAATGGKHGRKVAIDAVKDEVLEAHAAKIEAGDIEIDALKEACGVLERRAVRGQILDDGLRADGRKTDEVRPIEIEVGFLPRTHGSALFTRGETQAIITATLGTGRDSQRIDGLVDPFEKMFLLHYNFPAYCVGETWPNRGPKRREIGHGTLAERSVEPLLPEKARFPYSIRVVSEVTESNGSSSMATVCGATLSLMDAGVPIKRPVAGIAMGLIKEGDRYAVLSDILGLEDHEGDMDFKVAGTQVGITGFQMDIKVKGISTEIMKKALEQARQGRIHILREMIRAIDQPRQQVSEWAPRLVQVRISTDKIGALIGPGGKNIRKIQEETGCTIDIDDESGTATVAGGAGAKVDECVKRVRACTEEVEVGKIYEGRVVSIKDFGAFVEVLPGTEGMVHVSELSAEYVHNIQDHVSVGDVIRVKVLAIDAQNRIRLSKKAVEMEEKGELAKS